MKHTLKEIKKIYELPMPSLFLKALEVQHDREYPNKVRLSALQSIKTGRCSEDCAFCSQSIHHNTNIQSNPLMDIEQVVAKAKQAKSLGATRFCLGAAWRKLTKEQINQVLEMITAIKTLDINVCCTFGMISVEDAKKIKKAGCEIYNHNIETSPKHYANIVTTHKFEDRINTLKTIREAGLKVCCGIILGIGESMTDRFHIILELANMDPQPDVVPINKLMPVKGTPLENAKEAEWDVFIRFIATMRIFVPNALIHVPAGRDSMSEQMQTLCYLAGMRGIAIGDKLLTLKNVKPKDDFSLLNKLGLVPE